MFKFVQSIISINLLKRALVITTTVMALAAGSIPSIQSPLLISSVKRGSVTAHHKLTPDQLIRMRQKYQAKLIAEQLAITKAQLAAANARRVWNITITVKAVPTVALAPPNYGPTHCTYSDGSTASNRLYGNCRAIEIWKSQAEFDCLDWIWGGHESGWQTGIVNQSNTNAAGIPQANPYTKIYGKQMPMERRGSGLYLVGADATREMEWGFAYMAKFGTPCGAKSYWLGHGSY